MDETQANPDVNTRRRKRRGCLLGCLITLLAMLVIGGGVWLYVRGHLGELASGLVREQADKSLNGRLEFAKLEIDLAGRAVLHDAEVFMEDEQEPVFSCPTIVARFDPFNFIGPNRGRRAVEVTLQQPRVIVVREPDGSINLTRLIKQSDEPSENPIGISVQLRDAQVVFSDWCMLSKGYPKITASPGLALDLLNELGYQPGGPSEQIAFEETFALGGSVVVNPEREELSINIEVQRPEPGGVLTVKGSAKTDGKTFDLRLGARGMELASLQSYSAALFPNLPIALSTDTTDELPTPSVALMINNASVNAVQAPGQKLRLSIDSDLAGMQLRSEHLPSLSLPRISAHYDPDPQRVNGELTLQALGAEIKASGRYNIDEDSLDATANLINADLSTLLAQYGVDNIQATGTVDADAKITGSTKTPTIEAKLSSTALKLDKLNLGKLKGTAKLEQQVLTLSGVELTGGELPLRASGSLNLEWKSGELSATVGPLTVSDALALAGRFSKDEGSIPKLDADGKLQASASVQFEKGKPQGKLRLWSDALAIQGYKLTEVDVQGNLQAPSINLDAAQATLTLPQAIDTAGFTSDGPLKASLRIGGSVSLLEGGKPLALALTGSGATKNLAPEQANLSFKVIGPANAPDIRVQLKTTQAEHPLVLSANAKYKHNERTPVNAKLTWFDTAINFDGAVNTAKQSVSGKLAADKVNLARFVGKQGFSGIASLTADVGGTFKAPTVSGKIVAPQIVYAKDPRRYELTNASAGFKLSQGNSISINDGVFEFAGNRFKLGGTLGGDSGSLEIRSDPFNLFNVIASVTNATAQPGVKAAHGRPALSIDSKGVLLVKLTGKLDDPQASIDYSSPSGTVEGQHYTDARLLATANMTQANISNFSIKSASGSITASGVAHYDPLTYQAGAKINNFNLGVITPVIGVEMLQKLTGLLNGTASVNGEGKHFTADGALSLSQGQFAGMALDSARAEFRTSGEALELTSLTVTAQGTQLTASGTIHPDMAKTRLTASAPRLELALLNPLLPDTIPDLGGMIKLDASFAPGSGKYPHVQLAASNYDAITIDGTSIGSLSIKADLKNDNLSISQGDITLSGGQLNLSGDLELGRGRQVQGKDSYPLDFAVQTQGLDLGALLAALPEQAREKAPYGLDGKLTCDVHLSGMTHDPQLQGSVGFDLDLSKIEQVQGFGLTGVAGNIDFAKNEFKKLDIQLKATEGSGLSTARITGSGAVALNPLRLTPGSAIDIVLAPAGSYTTLNAAYPGTGSFNGSLAGTIHIRGTKQTDLRAEVTGNVVFNAAEEKSTIFLKMPDSSSSQETKPAPFRFGNSSDAKSGLQLIFKPGTEVEGPYDLRAQLNGDITLHGRPGVKTPPDRFEINGKLYMPEGSLFVYRHTIRLDKSYGNYLSFSGGELFPYLTARGALILPNVLSNSDMGTAQSITGIQQTQIGSARDLTIYFTFNNIRLGSSQDQLMNEVQLSSQPALSTDKIQQYLLGGAGELLAGHGDFGDIAQGELVGFGASFISREIERMLDLQAFRLGTGEGGSYYTYVEKELNDDVSLTYYKDFFSQTGQKEQWGVKYQLYDVTSGSRYENLTLNVNFTERGYGGSGSEFMFQWSTKF